MAGLLGEVHSYPLVRSLWSAPAHAPAVFSQAAASLDAVMQHHRGDTETKAVIVLAIR